MVFKLHRFFPTHPLPTQIDFIHRSVLFVVYIQNIHSVQSQSHRNFVGIWFASVRYYRTICIHDQMTYGLTNLSKTSKANKWVSKNCILTSDFNSTILWFWCLGWDLRYRVFALYTKRLYLYDSNCVQHTCQFGQYLTHSQAIFESVTENFWDTNQNTCAVGTRTIRSVTSSQPLYKICCCSLLPVATS